MKTLITRLCAAVLSLALAGSAQAQTVTPADTARFYKHHLGLTASPVLDKFFTANRSLPVGLLYKRQLTPKKALRLRLVGAYSQRDTSNYWAGVPTSILVGYIEGPNTTTWNVAAFGGLEWQRPLGKRFRYAYGTELGAGWNRTRADDILQFPDPNQVLPATSFYMNTITVWSAQLRPFLSLQYRVTNTTWVFAESAAALAYSHRQQDIVTRTVYVNSTGNGGRNNTSNALAVSWRPVQLLGVAYAF